MEEEKKMILQRIIEQKTEQVKAAIELAIEDGAKIIKSSVTSLKVEDVLVFADSESRFAVVLSFKSDAIKKALESRAKENEREALLLQRAKIEERLKELEK